MTKKSEIYEKAVEVLRENRDGLSRTQLCDKIFDSLDKKLKRNTIMGYIGSLATDRPGEVVKPDKGIYQLKEHADYDAEGKTTQQKKGGPDETKFYAPFAGYLKDELGECTEAIPLIDKKFGEKWRTPDVLGTNKFEDNEVLRDTPIEIVSAEIKATPSANSTIEGFGQACAYKAFSHKVYLVIPKSSTNRPRIELLCMQFGIGLILFDTKDPDQPQWEIRARATKSEPDFLYADEILQKFNKDERKRLLSRH